MHISAGEENSVKFAEIDRAMASALEQVPVGDRYAQVSYEDAGQDASRTEGYLRPLQ